MSRQPLDEPVVPSRFAIEADYHQGARLALVRMSEFLHL
jgi:hypothetical protein